MDPDLEAVRLITSSSGFFSPAEVDMACELVSERLQRGLDSGYLFLFAETGGRTVGFSCFGPIACTESSFDLYWIAVLDEFRGLGLGRELLRGTESRIWLAGGRRVYVDTASKPQYRPTRDFYERNGYRAEARLCDFYLKGDDKIIYSKELDPARIDISPEPSDAA
ncbi:MAG: GNAT family N-acetyltransferase [Desulfovibrionaceae bacterium]|nr:GNAT family N-acetyltransferase [Desulfovibrionaceae bacterium]MDD4951571.1 GNAT family N-acetyltransferase [Desulfovibrionaceae bacterium]